MSFYKWIQRFSILVLLGLGTAHASSPTAEDYYYGFGVEQDYQKAYALFKKKNEITYLVLMHINGEGRPKNLAKAAQVLKAKEEYCLHTSELKQEIKARRGIPEQEHRRLAYCDLAYTTIEMNHCSFIQNRLAEKKHVDFVAKIKNKLAGKERELLRKIEQQSKRIENNDGARMYLLYIDGSIRNIASAGMKRYISERHHRRIKRFLINKSLPRYSDIEFRNADKKLNEVFQAQRINAKETYQGLLHDDPKRAEEYGAKENMKEKLAQLKHAQLAWIAYRDTWAKLLMLQRPDGFTKDTNILISIKTVLTKERTVELKYDPVGPG